MLGCEDAEAIGSAGITYIHRGLPSEYTPVFPQMIGSFEVDSPTEIISISCRHLLGGIKEFYENMSHEQSTTGNNL